MKYVKIFVFLVGLVSLGRNVSGKYPLNLIYRRQVHMLIELIESLNSFYRFDNIIFYCTPHGMYQAPMKKTKYRLNGSHIHTSSGDIVTEYALSGHVRKPIMTFSIEPWDYVNDTGSIPNLGRILTNKNLAVVVLNDIFNTDLKEFVSTSLGASLDTKLVFLLIGQELTDVLSFIRMEKLQRFFRWCWSKNMLKVVLLFQTDHVVHDISELYLEVYTYTPFPKPIKFIQLTNENPKTYFVDRTLDLNGYEFKTPVAHAKPSVFKVMEHGTEHVTGIAGHLYVEFVKKIKAKFTEIGDEPTTPLVADYQNDLLTSRNIDIGIHPFSFMLPNNYYGSYPISNTNSCVVVPVVPEIFPGLYIPLTLNSNMWLLLLIMFFVFQVVYIIIDIKSYGMWRPWNNISITLRGMLNMPLGNISVGTSKRRLLIHMLVILSGMLFSQIHIAALTSFLSTTIYGHQLETIDDLRRANVSIMLVDYMFHIYNYLDLIPTDFQTNLVMTDFDTASKHLNSLNTSYAFIVYNEEWKILQYLQKNLWKPRFRVAQKLCIPNIYLSWPMQFNSPFYHPLKNFILRIQETGLELKWTDDILWDIRQTTSGNVSLAENRQHPAPLTLVHCTALWCVYGVGMFFSTLVFLYEKYTARDRRQRRRQNIFVK